MKRFFDFPDSLLSYFQEIDDRFDLPRTAQPLDMPLRAAPIGDIRAVLWDIYGTLFGCSLGDLEASLHLSERQRQAARILIEEFHLLQPLTQLCPTTPAETYLTERLVNSILDSHQQSRAAGVEYPEVIIEHLWQRIAEDCLGHGMLSPNDEPTLHTAYRWAYFYEAVLEKTYFFPAAAACLDRLHRAGLTQGIISNAQFYTPIRLRQFLRHDLARAELGLDDIFTEPLVMFSYELGCSKPNPLAFERCLAYLDGQGIAPSQTLYIGNDMLNDIHAAQQLGLKTVLFIGDAEQVRLYSDEPRCRNIEPDAIIADLGQLPDLILP